MKVVAREELSPRERVRRALEFRRPDRGPVIHDLGLAVVRDLTICCSVASPNAFEQTLRLMAAGKIQTKPLVTHVLDLEEAPKAFEIQQTQPEQRIKIHLRPPQG